MYENVKENDIKIIGELLWNENANRNAEHGTKPSALGKHSSRFPYYACITYVALTHECM